MSNIRPAIIGQPEILVERFWAKVDRRSDDECWPWLAGVTSKGYGSFHVYKDPATRSSFRSVTAHRVAYELMVGRIPARLELDHLCRNRRCVNPSHLEPVTHRENGLRGTSFAAQKARQTHCVNGHPLSGDNLYVINARGHRACKACNRAAQRRYQARKRQRAVEELIA